MSNSLLFSLECTPTRLWSTCHSWVLSLQPILTCSSRASGLLQSSRGILDLVCMTAPSLTSLKCINVTFLFRSILIFYLILQLTPPPHPHPAPPPSNPPVLHIFLPCVAKIGNLFYTVYLQLWTGSCEWTGIYVPIAIFYPCIHCFYLCIHCHTPQYPAHTWYVIGNLNKLAEYIYREIWKF